MLLTINHQEISKCFAYRFIAAVLAVMIIVLAGAQAGAVVTQKGFVTAEDAVKTLIAALKTNDEKELLTIFGEEAEDLIFSGDPVADQQRRERFISAYELKNSIVQEEEGMILVIGEKDWPFPIPLVKKEDMWFFDTEAGIEEILNRRIGENELNTIQVMLAIVDAEREYAMEDRDGDGLMEYAQKFFSDAGKRNGLHWKTNEGEAPSPLGELVAEARAEGYTKAGTKEDPVPYHGYFFRILTAQGKNAPGGAYDYVVKGKMIGGFAVVAYPAEYGNSGIMTFIVNHDGVVYQKDLGEDTEKVAKALEKYDPDTTWIRCP